MGKILHLVLFSNSPCYNAMKDATQKLYELYVDRVDTWYYHRDPSVSVPTLDAALKVLRLPGEETYFPGILDKTIDAFEFMFDPNVYDCIVRSNVSTVVNFAHLLQHISAGAMYGGTHIMCSDEISGSEPIENTDKPLQFAQGTCIILGPSIVDAIVKNRSLLNRTIEDDASIALLLKRTLKIRPSTFGTQYKFFSTLYNISDVSAFRNHHFHSNREEDTLNVRRATKTLQDFASLPKGRLVWKVWYHTLDVLEKIKQLCDHNNGTWASNGNNMDLDRVFGDPAPGVLKHLYILCNHALLTQTATMLFMTSSSHEESHQPRKLFVRIVGWTM